MEELLLLETEDRMGGDGKPKDKEYLGTGLPESLQHAIDEFVRGEKEQVSHMDCLWGSCMVLSMHASGETGLQKSRQIICGKNICSEERRRRMIDFTPCEVNKFKAYGGANGNKIHIQYQKKGYMLKFPPVPGRSKTMSYTNSCISEYLACHIYEMLGLRAQETILGTYTDRRGKEKTVVACRDFTDNGKKLIEFAQLKNTCINSEQNGYGTELSSIMTAIGEQELIPAEELKGFLGICS